MEMSQKKGQFSTTSNIRKKPSATREETSEEDSSSEDPSEEQDQVEDFSDAEDKRQPSGLLKRGWTTTPKPATMTST